jgi:hypothetical protein
MSNGMVPWSPADSMLNVAPHRASGTPSIEASPCVRAKVARGSPYARYKASPTRTGPVLMTVA